MANYYPNMELKLEQTNKETNLKISYKYVESEDTELRLNRAFDILFREMMKKEESG